MLGGVEWLIVTSMAERKHSLSPRSPSSLALLLGFLVHWLLRLVWCPHSFLCLLLSSFFLHPINAMDLHRVCSLSVKGCLPSAWFACVSFVSISNPTHVKTHIQLLPHASVWSLSNTSSLTCPIQVKPPHPLPQASSSLLRTEPSFWCSKQK